MSFEGKVVLVTGAASGIAAATALRFAQLSANLVLVDRQGDQLKKTQELCQREGCQNLLSIVADLSNREELLAVIPKCVERFGKLDVLVNAAGIVSTENILHDDFLSNYDRLMSVNLLAPIVLTNKAAPYLVQTKGSIINIASIATAHPKAMYSLYCASKSALEMFTKSIAAELAFKGVRVNSVHPGWVRTKIFDGTVPDVAELFKEMDQCAPLGLIEPEEIARVITFLAGDDARRITGSSYFVDAGIIVTNAILS